jgi:hypothetical protein
MNNNKNALILFMLGALLPLCACESSRVCPPCETTYTFKEIPKPYPVILRFKPLPLLVLPDYPARPGPEATEQELKDWSLEVERVSSEREVLRVARIKALEERERFIGTIEETYEIPDAPPD